MICPNCKRKSKYNFCIFCGYMENGNYITKRNIKPNDLELILNDEYFKVTRNENILTTFLLGPLYLSYRGFPIIGFILEIINILTLIFLGIIGGYITLPTTNLATFFITSGFLIEKLIYTSFNNLIYLNLLAKKINTLKLKHQNNYQTILEEKYKTKNPLLPLLTIIIYIIILISIILIYKITR